MSKANTLAGVSVGLAVLTFVALNLIWPFKPTQETLKANPTSDSVFASDIASAPAAEPVVKPQPGDGAPAPSVADSEPAASAAVPEEPAAAAESPDATPVQQQLAAAPEPSPAAPAPPAEATPAPAAPAPEPAAAVTETPAATESSSSEPVAAPSEAAAPSKPRKPKAATAPRADALAQWWPSAPTPGRLNLLYAGQAAQSPAIALLFDSVFADATAAGNAIRVVDAQGRTVGGSWELASNRRLLLLKAKPGRYTLVVGADLANQRGQTLAAELHGPVYVR